MRITRKQALALISRLSRTAKYPEADEELTRAAETLIEAAGKDATKAEQIVEALRKECEFFPPDASFFRVAALLAETAVPTWAPKREITCSACGDTGRVSVQRNGYDCAAPCQACELGRKMASPRPAAEKPAARKQAELQRVDARMLAAGEEN